MARPQPQPDPDDLWPSCDEQPPGVSIRPLSHADLQALLAHLDQHEHDDEDEGLVAGSAAAAAGGPVVAVRVRASVGRPGASAHAEYRRRRAAERAAWTRSLPWRAGRGAGRRRGRRAAGRPARSRPGWRCWRWRPRPGWAGGCGSGPAPTPWPGGAGPPGSGAPPACSPPWSAVAGRCCTTWPSPAPRPTSITWSSAPAGCWSIDTKQYRGRLRLDRYGMVWHGRHLLVSALRKVLWEADQADEVLGIADIQVAAIVAVHGASVPWGVLQADGVTIVPARRLPDLLQALPPILGPERVAWLADRARLRFRAAA